MFIPVPIRSKPTEIPERTCPTTGVALATPATIPPTPATVWIAPRPEVSLAPFAAVIIPAPSCNRPRIAVPFETAAAPLKRLSSAETAPPPGISPIASIPVLKAPLAIAFVTHGFLYHGVGGAALMVSPLFAATAIAAKFLRALFFSSQTHPTHTQSTCRPATCSSVDRNTLVVGKLTLESGQAEPARSPQKHSVRT
jgi:hypothetical protein